MATFTSMTSTMFPPSHRLMSSCKKHALKLVRDGRVHAVAAVQACSFVELQPLRNLPSPIPSFNRTSRTLAKTSKSREAYGRRRV